MTIINCLIIRREPGDGPGYISPPNDQMANPFCYTAATVIAGVQSSAILVIGACALVTSPIVFVGEVLMTGKTTTSQECLHAGVGGIGIGVVGLVATPLLPVASMVGQGYSFARRTIV